MGKRNGRSVVLRRFGKNSLTMGAELFADEVLEAASAIVLDRDSLENGLSAEMAGDLGNKALALVGSGVVALDAAMLEFTLNPNH